MAKRMLIDSTHPEETRVVVIDGNRLDDFDFESATKKQLKGNIYLARVTRVEPSLQAAFVEYGGGRHGFLAFSEIHPDYYRIPVADREALLAAEAEQARRQDLSEFGEARGGRRRSRRPRGEDTAGISRDDSGSQEQAWQQPDKLRGDEQSDGRKQGASDSSPAEHGHGEHTHGERARGEHGYDEHGHGGHAPGEHRHDDGAQADHDPGADRPASTKAADMVPAERVTTEAVPEDGGAGQTNSVGAGSNDGAVEADGQATDAAPQDDGPSETAADRGAAADRPRADTGNAAEGGTGEDQVETLGGDEFEEASRRRARSFRRYKIQEVIKRRQIMLVQVVKEERGNKGAALTTYLSLAGRYCVLMPNTARGGGISRKITSAGDRKRLKSVLDELEIPDGMAVIVRTAGSERSKPEVKRDYEYLMRLWDSIREQTLQSSAPALIHEEANLIKRSIRDLYARDIDEVLVDGEEGYRVAKDFMRMLMPSHSKRVQPYRDPVPLFQRFQVESQIDAIHQPICQLRSGGYIVINQTEALVAIDVNSGRATRERHIEETALKTNLEASDEIARQLRLRDLAGLIVIDFIDMEDNRNNHAVERRFKEAMRFDRARIQIGRISPFGLLELSRQRLRPSLVEASTDLCPHCGGTGRIRSADSAGLHVLRAIEDEALRGKASEIAVHVAISVGLYILNQKRPALNAIEQRYAIRVLIECDDTLIPPAYRIDRLRERAPGERVPQIETRPGMANIDPEAEAAADAAAEAAARALDREADEADEADAADVAESRPVLPAKEAPHAARVPAAHARGDDERRLEEGGRKRRRRRRGRRGELGSEPGSDRIAEHDGERPYAAGQPVEPGAPFEDRFANALETRRPHEFKRRALPTPAEFEVGEAGMFGRPALDAPVADDAAEPAIERQPGAERPYDSRPDDDGGRKRRRRGRRGGRRRHRGDQPEGMPDGEAASEAEAPVTRVVPPAALDMEQPSIPDWPRAWPADEAPRPAAPSPRLESEAPAPSVVVPAAAAPMADKLGADKLGADELVVRAPEPAPVAPPIPAPRPEPVLQGDLLGEPKAAPRKGWWRRG
jgi:ribonuclease E